MTSRNTYYAANYFCNHTLKKMHGEPEYDDLILLRNHIIANFTSVTSDLGGGNYEHLGLCLTAVQYNSTFNTAYRSTHPGALAPVRTTQHETVVLRDDWERVLELYEEITLVEKAIPNQIIEAIDERDVKTLVDRTTRTIQRTISEILVFLFDRYGQIEDEDFAGKGRKN